MRLIVRFIAWIIAKWAKDPDLRDLMVDTTNYTNWDRYRDFHKVFGTPEGGRVLDQILKWGHVLKTSMNKDVNNVLFSEGERNLALKILAGLTAPAEQPQRRNK